MFSRGWYVDAGSRHRQSAGTRSPCPIQALLYGEERHCSKQGSLPFLAVLPCGPFLEKLTSQPFLLDRPGRRSTRLGSPSRGRRRRSSRAGRFNRNERQAFLPKYCLSSLKYCLSLSYRGRLSSRSSLGRSLHRRAAARGAGGERATALSSSALRCVSTMLNCGVIYAGRSLTKLRSPPFIIFHRLSPRFRCCDRRGGGDVTRGGAGQNGRATDGR